MKIFLVYIFLLCSSLVGFSQIRMDKLVVKAGKPYELFGSDILVVDTLIMLDSAKIFLNRSKPDNFIHAKIIKVGKGCQITGAGENGLTGDNGIGGYTAVGPCKNGTPGSNGKPGTSATDGVNLFLYFNHLQITGSLMFALSGGDGGDGGRGGNGGGGSPGTRLCPGGDGGPGGNGASGGNGGDGGNLTLTCNGCTDLRTLLGNKILVRSYGGNAGLGGDGGQGGLAGLVSAGRNTQDGTNGPKGKTGERGESGRSGAINFEQQ